MALKPQLVVVSGPLEGQAFRLHGERLSIGRHSDNDLQLARRDVSRHHCVVERLAENEAEEFFIRDLGSLHGTFVNGQPVRARRLNHGDQLAIGETHLLLLLDDAPADAPVLRALPTESEVFGTTLQMKPGDTVYLDPQRLGEALPPTSQMARDLNALLKVSTSLQGPLDVNEISRRVLDAVFEVVGAQRGALLLREPGVEELTATAIRHEDDEDFEPSRTVVRRVLDEQIGLCCADTTVDDTLREAESIHAAALRSVLAVPVIGHDGLLGVLYADSRSSELFEERQLELLTALAGMASLALNNAYHLRWLESENRRLQETHLEHDMIGESASIQRVLELIGRVATVDSTVLLRGESGTGKELAARAVHRSSPRADGPFVAINCATLSETLLESELFGHEKGAFTGAVGRKVGKVEAAHRGTLFLDEVGEVPMNLQARLLRVLQERELERVGGSRPIPVDVRLVAATNRDLEAMIRDGEFREDLYYRLKVITCEMPPLRERRDDIPLLASHFAAAHGRKLRRRTIGVAPAARRQLLAYDWPGNVRELANVIERAVVLGGDDVIRPEDLPDEVREAVADGVDESVANPSRRDRPVDEQTTLGGEEILRVQAGDLQSVLTATKKSLIRAAWMEAAGDVHEAARILGIHVNSLHRMIRNLGMKAEFGR